jgi:3-phosphoshikimate 1-carboxyvinyltransferase
LLRRWLPEFGARVELAAGGLSVSGPDRVQGVDLDLSAGGELTPVLAAIAALASGPSRLRGIGHLRGHETDRIAAIASELDRLGGRVRTASDGLEIYPAPLRGGEVRTYGDHRMAMFAAVIGLVIGGIEVEDVAVTAKTMPDFTDRWHALVGGGGDPGGPQPRPEGGVSGAAGESDRVPPASGCGSARGVGDEDGPEGRER